MLLGVLFHAIMFGGGMMMGPGGDGGAAPVIMNWIHSFRMPLFFLISGFFSHMMLEKYGAWKYLARRWTRIGIPFLMVLFVLAAIRTYGPQNNFPFGGGGPGPDRGEGPGGPGGPGGPEGPGFGGPPGMAGRGPGAGGFPGPGAGPRGDGASPGFNGETPAPPSGFVPPFLARFDKDKDGSLSPEEWKEAKAFLEEMGRNAGRPGGPRGGGGPGGPGGFPGVGMNNPISEKWFGSASRNFNFAHLWFLWYLLVFASAALPVSLLLGRLSASGAEAIDAVGSRILGWGLGPLSLAILSLGGLYLSGTSPGQPPSGFRTIMGVFPDTLFRWDTDWPYFFTYFMWGWLLFRLRNGLPALGRLWIPTLAIGFIAYSCLRFLPESGPFGGGANPLQGVARLGGFLLFAVAASHLGVGLIGLFQRYVNRPTRLTRYLADTAFWIYLVHQDLIQGPVLSWVRPMKLQPLPQAFVTVAITVGIALITFEFFIRRTPLTVLFGPAPVRKPIPSPTLSPSPT